LAQNTADFGFANSTTSMETATTAQTRTEADFSFAKTTSAENFN
jgi:hypothetical protein